MWKKAFVLFLYFSIVAFGITDKEKNTLLKIIQGAYEDRLYSISLKKGEEYLKKTSRDDKYRAEVLKVVLFSAYYLKNKNEFLKWLNVLEKEKVKGLDRFYRLALELFKDEPDKFLQFYKKLEKYLTDEEKKRYIKIVAILLAKKGNWKDILSLPKDKSINLYRVIAFYKTGKYRQVIKETDKLSEFPPDTKDTVLYFRGLAFYKLGNEKKAVGTIEAITFKTPEMIKFLTNYYLKKKKYIYAERYLKVLSLEKEYQDYAFYYLGVLEDLSKNYKKAIHYYKKASVFNTKYGKLAKKRLQILEKALKNKKLFSVRIILLSKKSKAVDFIKKNNLKDCFVKKYKNLYGVYCGSFETKKEAIEYSKKLKDKGFDTVISKI